MADSTTTVQRAPAQYKQPSRKGKKAWRKNVDVTQVQSGLEEIRDEIIQGGILSERPSEQLFTLDVAGQDSVKNEYRNRHKPLKSDEILAQRSAVPPVDSRKRKAPDGIATGSSKRNKNGSYVSYADLQRLKALANAAGTAPSRIEPPSSAAYDPWAVQQVPDQPLLPFLEEKKPVKQPETLQHPPISLASNGKPFAAVKKPRPANSYNPAFEEWDALITREGRKEVDAENKRVQDAKVHQDRMDKALAEAAIPEPDQDDNDDYESAWESEWEGIQSEAENSHLNKKRPERKTLTERSKIKKRKEAEAKAKWEKQQKKKEDQQNRIRELTKQVEKKERQRKSQAAIVVPEPDSSSDEDETLRRRKFGKNPIPEAPLELVLADELQDSLRALRPEGNLLKDRFRNLLLNGKIEARTPIWQSKKPRREVTEKWSYKDWKLR